MPKLIKKLGIYLISPEKMILRLAGMQPDKGGMRGDVDEKFNIDSSGTFTLNRRNAEVQRAFASNVEGLSTKSKG